RERTLGASSMGVVRRIGQAEEVLQGVEPARVVRGGEFGTDVAQMPRLGDVPGGPGGAPLVPHDESVLPGVLGHPGALLRLAEPADLPAPRAAGDDVDREPGLMLAVTWP